MTRILLATVAFLCLLVLRSPVAADNGEQTDNAETTRGDSLNGAWEMVSFEFMGQKLDVPKGQEQTLTFNAGKVSMKQPAAMRNETGSYRLNDRKRLKEIDMITPVNGNPTMKALYQINGDTLKIAFSINGPGGERPTSFEGQQIGIIVLKRKK